MSGPDIFVIHTAVATSNSRARDNGSTTTETNLVARLRPKFSKDAADAAGTDYCDFHNNPNPLLLSWILRSPRGC